MSSANDMFGDDFESPEERRRTRTITPGSYFLTGDYVVNPSPIVEEKREQIYQPKMNAGIIYSSDTESTEEEKVQCHDEENIQANPQRNKIKEAPTKKTAKGNSKKNKQVTSEQPKNEKQLADPSSSPLKKETSSIKTKQGKKDNAGNGNFISSRSPEHIVQKQNMQTLGLKTEEVEKLLLDMTLDEDGTVEDTVFESEDCIPLGKGKSAIQNIKAKDPQPKKITKVITKKNKQGSEQSDSIKPTLTVPNSPEKEEMVIKKNKRGKKDNTAIDMTSAISSQDALKSKNNGHELGVINADNNKQNKQKKVAGKINNASEINSELHLATKLKNDIHAEITEKSSENTNKGKRNLKSTKSGNTTQESTKNEKQSAKMLSKENTEAKIKPDKSLKHTVDENSAAEGNLLTVTEETEDKAPNRPIRSTRAKQKNAVLTEVNEPVQNSVAVMSSNELGTKKSGKNMKKVHEEMSENKHLLSEDTKKPTKKIETSKNKTDEDKQREPQSKPKSKVNQATVKKPSTNKENKLINEESQATKPKRAAKK